LNYYSHICLSTHVKSINKWQKKRKLSRQICWWHVQSATCPVHELTSLRDVQSISHPVRKLAVRKLSSTVTISAAFIGGMTEKDLLMYISVSGVGGVFSYALCWWTVWSVGGVSVVFFDILLLILKSCVCQVWVKIRLIGTRDVFLHTSIRKVDQISLCCFYK